MGKISVDNLEVAVADLLKEYGDMIYKATEEGVTAAEKVLIKNLKEASPKGKTGEYAKSWKSKGKKYKLKRYVGNTKTIIGKKGKEIPLSNVLEYNPKSKHQGLIKRTFESSIEEMAEAIVNQIKKGD